MGIQKVDPRGGKSLIIKSEGLGLALFLEFFPNVSGVAIIGKSVFSIILSCHRFGLISQASGMSSGMSAYAFS